MLTPQRCCNCNTVNQLIVTPTNSRQNNIPLVSSGSQHSLARLGVSQFAWNSLEMNLMKNYILKLLLKYFSRQTDVTGDRMTAKTGNACHKRGMWHGCRHSLLPCNFQTCCFLHRNRKKIVDESCLFSLFLCGGEKHEKKTERQIQQKYKWCKTHLSLWCNKANHTRTFHERSSSPSVIQRNQLLGFLG